AVLALRHLAHVIVFVLDPSEFCGYTLDAQMHILENIRSNFPHIPVIEVENKVDILKGETNRLKISALNGDGIDKLRNVMVERVGDLLA
ncbi:MAG: GTPase, partial [Thermoplasmata archaeon]